VALKKMQKMKEGKVLVAIPEKYMYQNVHHLSLAVNQTLAEAKMKQHLPALALLCT